MTVTDSAIHALGIERDEALERARVLEGSAQHLAGQVLDLEARNAELQKDLDEAYQVAASARVRCRELEEMKERLGAWCDELADGDGKIGVGFFAIELASRMRGDK